METNFKKYNLDTLTNREESIPVTKDVIISESADVSDNVLLLQRCRSYWDSLYDFRERRERNRKYYRGFQWGDKIYNPDTGSYETEDYYIRSQGKVPLKQNQIRQMCKSLIGQFRLDTTRSSVISRARNQAQVGEMLTNTLQYGLQINEVREKDVRSFEEFLLSGSVMQRTNYAWFEQFQREDVKLRNMPITQAFFNPNIRDVDDDIDVVGVFHDMYIKDIVSTFSGGSTENAEYIMGVYGQVLKPNEMSGASGNNLSAEYAENLNFYTPKEQDKGRVFEIWYKKSSFRLRCHDKLKGEAFIVEENHKDAIDDENAQRFLKARDQYAGMTGLEGEELDDFTFSKVPLIEYNRSYEVYWYVKYLSWQGHVLNEFETPYEYKSHPFSLLLYPLVDGEVWGFVEDIIDQQRYINRLITLLDFVISSSSKGVLLVPEDSISDDFDINSIAEEWTKFNGVIKIKLKNGASPPIQMATKSTNIGINELLSYQLKFLTEVSGVSGAVQGQDGRSKSASLYAQETQNSSVNSKDYFETFNAFRKKRDWKMLKTQVQFYDSERQLALAGSNYNEESLTFDPVKAKDVQFDMTMGRSPDSPVYRGIIEDVLKEFVVGGFIDLEMYLKNSTLPFADNLLADIQKRKEEAMQGGQIAPGGQLMDKLSQNLQDGGGDASQADPKAVAMLNQYMKGLDQQV